MLMRIHLWLNSFLIIILSWGTPLHAADVTVAVAANFTQPMEKIARLFEQATGHQAALSFGATGKFYTQITHDAPFEVLLAADQATPTRLAKEGLAFAENQFTYAIGRLILWSPHENKVDDQGQVLKQGDFKHLAITNPKTAPYGAAAIEVITHLGLLESLTPRFVTGESITQTYQFVASGNAELGFVAKAQVYQDGTYAKGSQWMIPTTFYSPLKQDAVLLKRGQNNAAAKALLEFLKSESAHAVIRAFGYDLAD